VAVTTLLAKIKALGYLGSMNLLYRCITQDRVEGDRPPTSPRRLAGLLLTCPDLLSDKRRQLRDELSAACPQMIDLAELISSFAELLHPNEGNDRRLDEWVATARAADLPNLHAFTPRP
jgi:hypothetical protein